MEGHYQIIDREKIVRDGPLSCADSQCIHTCHSNVEDDLTHTWSRMHSYLAVEMSDLQMLTNAAKHPMTGFTSTPNLSWLRVWIVIAYSGSCT